MTSTISYGATIVWAAWLCLSIAAVGVVGGMGGCRKRVIRRGGWEELAQMARAQGWAVDAGPSRFASRDSSEFFAGAAAPPARSRGGGGGGKRGREAEESDEDDGLFDLFDSDASQSEQARWTIAIKVLEGREHRRRALQLKRRIESSTGLRKLWVDAHASKSFVYYGRYVARDHEQAREDRRRLKQLAAEGRLGGAGVVMMPLLSGAKQDLEPYDLRSAAGRGIYTLQIGVYTGESRKRSAEQAAADLRDKGVRAYYFHGPHRSMVTVGVFGQKAVTITPRGTRYSRRVLKLKQRFAYRRTDVQALTQGRAGGARVERTSMLVRIPKAGL